VLKELTIKPYDNMSDEKTSTKNVVTAVPKLVQLLEPLTPDERHRAISAALIVFGESAPIQSGNQFVSEPQEVGEGICPKAANWMKKNAITREQLDHVFSIENDSIDVIAARMPESGKRKQTTQAYILCGIRSFLRNGDLNFTDADARELCNKLGCYDTANHAAYTTSFGNLISGSKEAGWRLTNPGLSVGVQIVKQLAPEATNL
jgi:hypothetical protein